MLWFLRRDATASIRLTAWLTARKVERPLGQSSGSSDKLQDHLGQEQHQHDAGEDDRGSHTRWTVRVRAARGDFRAVRCLPGNAGTDAAVPTAPAIAPKPAHTIGRKVSS